MNGAICAMHWPFKMEEPGNVCTRGQQTVHNSIGHRMEWPKSENKKPHGVMNSKVHALVSLDMSWFPAPDIN